MKASAIAIIFPPFKTSDDENWTEADWELYEDLYTIAEWLKWAGRPNLIALELHPYEEDDDIPSREVVAALLSEYWALPEREHRFSLAGWTKQSVAKGSTLPVTLQLYPHGIELRGSIKRLDGEEQLIKLHVARVLNLKEAIANAFHITGQLEPLLAQLIGSKRWRIEP